MRFEGEDEAAKAIWGNPIGKGGYKRRLVRQHLNADHAVQVLKMHLARLGLSRDFTVGRGFYPKPAANGIRITNGPIESPAFVNIEANSEKAGKQLSLLGGVLRKSGATHIELVETLLQKAWDSIYEGEDGGGETQPA